VAYTCVHTETGQYSSTAAWTLPIHFVVEERSVTFVTERELFAFDESFSTLICCGCNRGSGFGAN
jgi:hypothetical protein